MRVSIDKSEVNGRVIVPSSKSYTIRALMCAALAGGKSEIIHPLSADDTLAACNVLHQVGIDIHQQQDLWVVNGGNFRTPDIDLYCGDSAATMRFMTAICSMVPGRCQLRAGPSLAKRPIRPLLEALHQLGVNCYQEDSTVIVEGGSLKGGTTKLPGDISSQYVSALLFISPLAEERVRIRLTTPLESKPYVLMTIECLERFGIKVQYSSDLSEFETPKQTYVPARCEVEGDWSSASYYLALGALAGMVELYNLNIQSHQGDKEMLNFLREMGAQVKFTDSSIIVKKSRLKAIRADLSDCIDLLPTMAVLAVMANGVSEFVGVARARIKESNRVAAMREGLARMGIKINEAKDKITIRGSNPSGAVIDAKGDHRIAMAFSVLGSVVGNTIIDGAESVTKTYPEFWEVFTGIGGKVKIHGE